MNRMWAFSIPLLFHFYFLFFASPNVLANDRCPLCQHEYKGEIVRTILKLDNGERISLEYDDESMGHGAFSQVFHAVMEKLNGRGQKSRKCVAYKLTRLTEELVEIRNAERGQKNEWEKLVIFGQMEENRRKYVIKMEGKGTFTNDDGDQFYFTILELGKMSFVDHILAKHNEWMRGGVELTDGMVEAEIRHAVMPLRDIHQKIIHQDIKSANLVLVDGEWKVIDFGIAQLIPDPGKPHPNANAPLYLDTATITTPFIMAPDHSIKQKDPRDGQMKYRYTTKNDIWAFGIILLQICSHKFVFTNSAGHGPAHDLGLKADSLRLKFQLNSETTKKWAEYFVDKWESAFNFFKFILGIRKCCPRTFHLIIATLKRDPMSRPTANGILSFLDNKCRFDSQKRGGEKRAFLPGLSLHELRKMLKKMLKEKAKATVRNHRELNELRELVELANWQGDISRARPIPQVDCDRTTNGGIGLPEGAQFDVVPENDGCGIGKFVRNKFAQLFGRS